MKILNNIQLEGSGSADRNLNIISVPSNYSRLFIYNDILYLQTADNQIIQLHGI